MQIEVLTLTLIVIYFTNKPTEWTKNLGFIFQFDICLFVDKYVFVIVLVFIPYYSNS